MSLEEKKSGWKDVSEEVLSGMIEWRLQHPKAALREIEQAVDERLGRLRKRMVEDAIQTSSAGDWSQQPKKDRPRCRQCGTVLVSRGKQKRRLKTSGGGQLELERGYGTCPMCGGGVFPLDEELALEAGSLTPQVLEWLVRLATWMPFGRAVQLLEAITNVKVGEETARRQTEQAGKVYEQVQDEEARRLMDPAEEVASKQASRLVLSSDGADGVPAAWGVGGGKDAGAGLAAAGSKASHADGQPVVLLAHDRGRRFCGSGPGRDAAAGTGTNGAGSGGDGRGGVVARSGGRALLRGGTHLGFPACCSAHQRDRR